MGGEPKLAIARRLEIDNSTVHYHINKIKHLPPQQVVALIKPECGTCGEVGSVWYLLRQKNDMIP